MEMYNIDSLLKKLKFCVNTLAQSLLKKPSVGKIDG